MQRKNEGLQKNLIFFYIYASQLHNQARGLNMSETMTQNELLTVTEAAIFLRRSRSSLDIFRHRRVGPPYLKIMGKILYKRSALEEYLLQCTIDPSANDPAPAKTGKSPAKPGKNAAKPAPRTAPAADKDAEPDFSQMKRGTPSKRKQVD